MASYSTVTAPVEYHSEPIKGSRFIADVVPVGSEVDATQALQAIRTQRPDASHHCWAWKLHQDAQSRVSDDGEPGGSAGRPILAQIEGHDLEDVLVVVSRYYGGTKLGVGGLIRAYGGTAGKALDTVDYRSVEERTSLHIAFAYGFTKGVDAVLRQYSIQTLATRYTEGVLMHLHVRVEDIHSLKEDLIACTSGKIRFP